MAKPAAPVATTAVSTAKTPKNFDLLLARCDDIPTLPIVVGQVNDLINNPNSSSADIAKVLKKDQVLTAKILKLINSPYYGIPSEVTDVQRALAFLGFNTLAQLVLGLSVFSLFPADKKDLEFSMLNFWRHALATAVCSEVIAKRIKHPKPEECFTCGLLHDIGKVVMYQIAKDLFMDVFRYARENKTSFVDAESKLDAPGHVFLGEHIAAKWGLPQVIRSAVRYHHLDVRETTTILASQKAPIQIVTLANALVVNMGIGHSGDYSDGQLQSYMYEVLKLDFASLEAIKKQTQEEMKKVGSFLNASL